LETKTSTIFSPTAMIETNGGQGRDVNPLMEDEKKGLVGGVFSVSRRRQEASRALGGARMTTLNRGEGVGVVKKKQGRVAHLAENVHSP